MRPGFGRRVSGGFAYKSGRYEKAKWGTTWPFFVETSSNSFKKA